MSVKNESASRYANVQKLKHGHKAWELPVSAIMTGDTRLGSIGEAIRVMIRENGGEARSYSNDVRGTVDFSHFASLDPNALILCHGVTYLEWFEKVDMMKVREIIDVNLTGTANMIQAFVRHTIKSERRKKIIVIGSMAYKAVLNGSAAYCASKAGLAHMLKCLAWELTPKGFDVYCVHPSNVNGAPMSEETITGLMRYRGLERSEAEAYWNDNPIRFDDIGEPLSLSTDEIAHIVQFLLSDHSAYMSGSNIELAGGQR